MCQDSREIPRETLAALCRQYSAGSNEEQSYLITCLFCSIVLNDLNAQHSLESAAQTDKSVARGLWVQTPEIALALANKQDYGG